MPKSNTFPKSVLSISKIQHARKIHCCDWCGELILLSTPYTKYVTTINGFQSSKYHDECFSKLNEEFRLKETKIFGKGSFLRGTRIKRTGKNKNISPCWLGLLNCV